MKREKKRGKGGKIPFIHVGPEGKRERREKGGSSASSSPCQDSRRERESEGGGEGGAPAVGGVGRTYRSPSPDHREERERGERGAVDERGRERFKGGGRSRSQRPLQGSPAVCRPSDGASGMVEQRVTAGQQEGRTESTPSQPKSNPKTGPLTWIRGGFPLPTCYF